MIKRTVVMQIILLAAIGANAYLSVENYKMQKRLNALVARYQAVMNPACDGTEPKAVPFVQGMTLCDGQEARGAIVIPLPSLKLPPAAEPRQQGQEM